MFEEGKPRSNRKVYSFRLKLKEDGKYIEPYFEGSTPDEDGNWSKIDSKPRNISGKLTQIKTKESVWQGQTIKSFVLRLEDADELYLVELGFTKLGRSIANSLLSLTDLDTPIKLSVYTNKNDQNGASLRQNEEMVSWKYSKEQLPEVKHVKLRGQDVYDYVDVEEFLLENLVLFAQANEIFDAPKQAEKTTSTTSATKTVVEEEVTVGVDDDDVLF